MATFSPETASRWVRPVALKRSATTGSRREVSPSVSPISRPASRGGNTRPNESRSALLRRSAARNNGPAGGPWNRIVLTDSSAGYPR